LGIEPLSRDDLYKIHEATLELLERTGVRVDNQEARSMLQKAGADVDLKSRVVKIPQHLVEWALKKAPRSLFLAGRRGNGKHDMRFERKRAYFTIGEANLYAADAETGERRPSTKKDIADAAKLADGLPNIDHVHPMFAYRTTNIGLHELDAMLRNTEKPVTCQDYGDTDPAYYVRLAAAVAGGEEELRRRPNILLYCEQVSPLTHADSHIRGLLTFAKARLPVVYIPCPSSGATAPATLAGALTQSNAEVLSGIAIAQLQSPGLPMMYGSIVAPFDMRTLNRCVSTPQYLLNTLAIAQLGRYYGLPVYSQGGASVSKVLDFQAVIEASLSITFAFLSGANLIHDAGNMEFALTGSLELVTIADDIVSMVRHTLSGFEVTDETIGLDVISKVGPGGNYLSQTHTKQWFKNEQWYSDLMDRWSRDTWAEKGSKTYQQRVREKTLQILRNHVPEPLPRDVISEMDNIVREAEENLGRYQA
jgi:trimethylamine--corrinoid protein Co-methyltransferase